MRINADRKRIDRVAIEWETGYRVASVEHARRLVRVADYGDDATDRHVEQLCPVCYVNGRIGGSRSTSRPCGLCDHIITSGSTDVDALCPTCADANMLCKRCGADIDLKNRRKPRAFEVKRKEAKP